MMPWQQLVADVGLELDPVSGLPAYREVVVTVPRQSGKTTLVLAWECQRAIDVSGWGGPQRIVYSAQTGNDARKKLVEDQLPILEPRKSALGISRILTGMGNEAVIWRNGSRLVLMASDEKSGHGKTVDLGIIDEAFADTDFRREQALIPAMITKPAAQIIVSSTMGTDSSVLLNQKVDTGRAMAAAGERSGIAYFEWSAGDDDDLDDPEAWWGWMPALGHTTGEEAIAHAKMSLPPGEFERAFGNRRMGSDERVWPADVWAGVNEADARPTEPLVLSVDVHPDRSSAAIAVSGGGVVEIIDHHPGVRWATDRVEELALRWDTTVSVDQAGPAGALIPELERRGVKVEALTGPDMAKACGDFYDAVADGQVRVRRHVGLDAAVEGAVRKSVGDAFVWARKSSSADVCPLVAATAAWWARPDGPSVYEDRGMVFL